MCTSTTLCAVARGGRLYPVLIVDCVVLYISVEPSAIVPMSKTIDKDCSRSFKVVCVVLYISVEPSAIVPMSKTIDKDCSRSFKVDCVVLYIS